MQKKFEIIGCCLGWFALIAQFVIMLQNRVADVPETILRFFSFFTILTNLIVTLFFTHKVFRPSGKLFKIFDKKGSLIAITTFILIVGIVYQFVLRGIWQPQGMQWLVDEFLHSVIPVYVLVYWLRYPSKEKSHFRDVLNWLQYPVVYLVFVLIRGFYSGFYPYPFLNIPEIGLGKVLLNILVILILLLFILFLLSSIENKRIKNRTLKDV